MAPLQNPGITDIVEIGTTLTVGTDAGTTTVMVGTDAGTTTTTADLVAEEGATVALGDEGEEFASTFETMASADLGKTADLATT